MRRPGNAALATNGIRRARLQSRPLIARNRPLVRENRRAAAGHGKIRLTTMLAINHLRKAFGPLLAVDDVSFSLGPGQLVGLLGPNGAGKTTTVSMIAGLLTPDRGEVLIAGHRLSGDTDPAK